MQGISDWQITHNNLAIKIRPLVDLTELREKIAELQRMPRETWPTFELGGYLDDLKFSICLPRDLLTIMMRRRLNDEEAIHHLLPSPIKQVHQNSGER